MQLTMADLMPVQPVAFGMADVAPAPAVIFPSQTVRNVYGVLAIASSGIGFYHGYLRNGGSLGWGLGWAIMGSIAPVLTPALAFAQGIGERAATSNMAGRVRKARIDEPCPTCGASMDAKISDISRVRCWRGHEFDRHCQCDEPGCTRISKHFAWSGKHGSADWPGRGRCDTHRVSKAKKNPYLREELTGRRAQEQARDAVFGPGFSEAVVSKTTRLEVWCSSFSDQGDDYCEFRAFDVDGKSLGSRRVGGY